jgi:hypothetical protein
MTRLPDWRSHLHRYLAEAGRREFAWGTWDCTHFAAGAVEAMTGEVLPRLDGEYTTAAGAARVLLGAGFGDVGHLVASMMPETGQPSEGDVAVVPDADGAPALGIVGRGVVHCVSPGRGLWASFEPPARAFRV